jgi:hypothetical protein
MGDRVLASKPEVAAPQQQWPVYLDQRRLKVSGCTSSRAARGSTTKGNLRCPSLVLHFWPYKVAGPRKTSPAHQRRRCCRRGGHRAARASVGAHDLSSISSSTCKWQRPIGVDARPVPRTETDCVAGVRGLELGNVALRNAGPNSLVSQNISYQSFFAGSAKGADLKGGLLCV